MFQRDHTHIDDEILIAGVLLSQEWVLLLIESLLCHHVRWLLGILVVIIFKYILIDIGVDEEWAMHVDAVILLIFCDVI